MASMLRTFAEYRRQPDFGCTVDEELNGWLIAPVGHNRDSDILTETNWDAQLKFMEDAEPENADDYRILRFSHWAVGWVEILIVRPGSACEWWAEKLWYRLEQYPCLDDDKLSERENDEYLEAWGQWGAADFVKELGRKFHREGAVGVLLEDADRDELRYFYENMLVSGEYYTPEGSGVHLHTRRAAEECTRGQLAEFVRKLRAVSKS